MKKKVIIVSIIFIILFLVALYIIYLKGDKEYTSLFPKSNDYSGMYIKETPEYKKLDIEKIDFIEKVELRNTDTITTKEDDKKEIKKIYLSIGNYKIKGESNSKPEDESTIFIFNMGRKKLQMNFEGNKVIIGEKQYNISK